MIEQLEQILADDEKLKIISADIFAQTDTDGSGFVEKDEFSKLINELTAANEVPQPNEEDMQDIFDMMDTNADGKIDQSEFVKLVRNYLEGVLDKQRSEEGNAPGEGSNEKQPMNEEQRR